ncbi:MAG: outer membrane protein transport protein [Gammaproteobacteria bacterium]|nr:outer membrane protein transport protein [Gammaproteobacteria bacterium]
MNQLSKRLLSTAIIIGLTIPASVFATNGYFMIGFGAKSRGMGGVGVAEGVDGLAAAFNPATMADVGTRFDIGGDLFYAPNTVTHSDGTLSDTTIVESSNFEDTPFSPGDMFLVPAMGGTYKYSDEITLGFAFFGAGMGTQYDQTLPAGNTSYFYNFNNLANSNKVGIKLMQVQIPLSIAYKLDDTNTVGASFVIGAQIFEAWGLKAFQELNMAATRSNVSDMGTDTSYGAGIRLGWTGRYLENDLTVGVNYSSRVYMTEFEDYSSLFAEHGDFDIPEHYALGFSYNAMPDLTVKFDIQQINFSDIASVGNPGPYAYNSTEFNPLCPGVDSVECKIGGDQGLGFGWTNQTVYKLGAEYRYNEKIKVRAGLNYGEATIPADQVLFNMVAPATIESHLTMGASYNFREDIEITASYVHGFENTITGKTLFQPLGSNPDITTDNAAISMKQRSMGVGLGIKW